MKTGEYKFILVSVGVSDELNRLTCAGIKQTEDLVELVGKEMGGNQNFVILSGTENNLTTTSVIFKRGLGKSAIEDSPKSYETYFNILDDPKDKKQTEINKTISEFVSPVLSDFISIDEVGLNYVVCIINRKLLSKLVDAIYHYLIQEPLKGKIPDYFELPFGSAVVIDYITAEISLLK